MRVITGLVAGFLVSFSASAAPVRAKGYVTKKGTYVAPHYQTAPNNTQRDNYSATGNTNPYTGKRGSKPPKK